MQNIAITENRNEIDTISPTETEIMTKDNSQLTTPKKRILTGDRPTGKLHLGHYVGSLKNRVKLQHEYETFIMVADVQALTDNYDDPQKIRENILETTMDNLAVGMDPNIATIFIQSMIPEIAELTVFFMNLITHEEVLRNPTVKDEIKQKQQKFKGNPPFGFVAYPVSQAADIHIVRANVVPVGADQAPMLELATDIASEFNRIYKSKIFNPIKGIYGEVARLVGTDGNAKMSKSLGNTIYLSDSEEIIKEKVKKMYTDPTRVHPSDPGKVEGNPVFIYHDAFNSDVEEVNDLKARYVQGKVGDVEVKDKLSRAINDFISPIREKRSYFENHKDEVFDVLKQGNEKVKMEAEKTMEMVRKAMGINYF
jgi:tryptophanyl-tRNA synthetase